MNTSAKPAAKPAAKQARRTAGKGAAPTKKATVASKAPRVRSVVLTGGYRVFDTPVEPKHTTRAKIAAAIAAVD